MRRYENAFLWLSDAMATLRMENRNMGSRRLGGSPPTGYRNISSVPAERCSTVAVTGTPSDDSPQMS